MSGILLIVLGLTLSGLSINAANRPLRETDPYYV